MATFNKRFTFAPGTTARADEVNANFNTVQDFLNNDVMHRDGSKAFSGIPALPSNDPTTANQATRKAYVDEAIRKAVAAAAPKGGVHAATTDANAVIAIPHGMGKLPSSVVAVGSQPENGSGTLGQVLVTNVTTTHAFVRCIAITGAPLVNVGVRVRWIAVP